MEKGKIGIFLGDYSYYNNGKIYNLKDDEKFENIVGVWSHHPALDSREAEYAFLYCGGQSLRDVCPPQLKEEYKTQTQRFKAYIRSLVEAKLNLEEHCIYDLIPEKVLKDYCEVKCKIVDHVFKTYDKPANYDYLVDLSKLIHQIGLQPLKINRSALKKDLGNPRTRKFYKKLKSINPYVKYKLFGTKTGRLTTEKKCFPVLTFDKRFRKAIEPTNDWFIELDYNASQLRILLALSGQYNQPEGDIHQWNIEHVFRGYGYDRDKAKQSIFAWMFNMDADNVQASSVYDRRRVIKEYWDGDTITNPFGRTMEGVTEHYALNYIIQSTEAEMFLRKALALNKLLEHKRSFISFTMHDAVILDFATEDKAMLTEIVELMRDTPLGTFRVNVKAGKNYGEMRDIEWKQ